jgi:murein L,D-transpeptidase YcbB/YkuD
MIFSLRRIETTQWREGLPHQRRIHPILRPNGVLPQVVMLKRIAIHSALAASLMAVLSLAALAQPSDRWGHAAPPEPGAAPWEASSPEARPQTTPQAQPKAKSHGPQAPGASAYVAPDASANPELEPIAAEIRSRLANVLSNSRGAHPDDAAGLAAFYSARNGQPVWTNLNGLNRRAAFAMTEILRADDWGLDASAFELPEPDGAEPLPADLASSEIKLSLAALKYARYARGGRIDYSEAFDLVDEKSRVYDPRSVLQAITAAESADAFLRDLHPKHEAFRRLREALLGMDKATASAPDDAYSYGYDTARADRNRRPSSSGDERQRIIVNMERWRLMPDDLGDFYVWNSIAEQYTRVFDHGKMVLKEKIVVGKSKTPTPMFSATMKYVIFHPEWGVPNSIKLNELAPKLREVSSTYQDNDEDELLWFGDRASHSNVRGSADVLGRLNLKVKLNGREIDPDTVDWNSVDIRRYQFIQPSGKRNVLGVVKFRFPNKHDVYMHDTPERKLFKASKRTFSHGCMRTQHPVHLAEVILAHDHDWPPEYIKQVLAEKGKPKEIKLNNPIPVHITYFTMALDDDGRLRTFPDVYGMDKLMTAALNGKPFRSGQKSKQQAVADANPRASSYREPKPRDSETRRSDSRDDDPIFERPDNHDRSRDRYSDDSSHDRRRWRDDDGDRERDRDSEGDTWSSGRWERLDDLFGR